MQRPTRRKIGMLGLFAGVGVATFVAVTLADWCVPAIHAALTLATALATWLLCREELESESNGSLLPVIVTGVSIGLALTWIGAGAAALMGLDHSAHWTHAEPGVILFRFIEDTLAHWTPLGLIAGFVGTGVTIALSDYSIDIGSDQHRHA